MTKYESAQLDGKPAPMTTGEYTNAANVVLGTSKRWASNARWRAWIHWRRTSPKAPPHEPIIRDAKLASIDGSELQSLILAALEGLSAVAVVERVSSMP